MFQNKSILITGGTGSFGKEFCIFLIKKKIPFRKIILFLVEMNLNKVTFLII